MRVVLAVGREQTKPQHRHIFRLSAMKRAGLSRRCPTGSHIALTAETATHVVGLLELQLEVAAAAAAGPVWQVKLWRWVACCLVFAW